MSGADDGEGRRSALKRMVVLGGAALGCAVGAPAAVFVVAPLAGGGSVGGGQWVRTVRLDALREGEPKKVSIVADRRDAWTVERSVELGSVWLVRRGKEVLALSTVCPHLGCAVGSRPAGGFFCPCHESDFDGDGAKKSGPSPRGMDPLATRIDDGVVAVRFQSFRTGTPQREAIG